MEANYKLTRRCLEVCAEFRNPVGVLTKSALIDATLMCCKDSRKRPAWESTSLDSVCRLCNRRGRRAFAPRECALRSDEDLRRGIQVGIGLRRRFLDCPPTYQTAATRERLRPPKLHQYAAFARQRRLLTSNNDCVGSCRRSRRVLIGSRWPRWQIEFNCLWRTQCVAKVSNWEAQTSCLKFIPSGSGSTSTASAANATPE